MVSTSSYGVPYVKAQAQLIDGTREQIDTGFEEKQRRAAQLTSILVVGHEWLEVNATTRRVAVKVTAWETGYVEVVLRAEPLQRARYFRKRSGGRAGQQLDGTKCRRLKF